ncbi:MAG: recombination protein O N-terminal domain-containing protein [Acholeplasmatales bacterium]|jgi:recombinational DNA repair protein (RecF pathway)|nr:recombination protein O N-terminal domain-containing protein [Acholeplasmatales bacterium]
MEGIIYRTSPYLDSSLLLQVITPKGLVTLVAKGALKLKSPYRYFCSFLNKISFEEKLRPMYSLMNAELINDYASIKGDLVKINYAVVLFKAISSLIDNFELLYGLINEALESPYYFQSILFLLTKILYLEGYGLDFTPSKMNISGFSQLDSGPLGEWGGQNVDLSIQEAGWLADISQQKYHDLSDEQLWPLLEFLNKYYNYHLGINLLTNS